MIRDTISIKQWSSSWSWETIAESKSKVSRAVTWTANPNPDHVGCNQHMSALATCKINQTHDDLNYPPQGFSTCDESRMLIVTTIKTRMTVSLTKPWWMQSGIVLERTGYRCPPDQYCESTRAVTIWMYFCQLLLHYVTCIVCRLGRRIQPTYGGPWFSAYWSCLGTKEKTYLLLYTHCQVATLPKNTASLPTNGPQEKYNMNSNDFMCRHSIHLLCESSQFSWNTSIELGCSKSSVDYAKSVGKNNVCIQVYKQTYYTENTESKKTKRNKTEKNIYRNKKKPFKHS